MSLINIVPQPDAVGLCPSFLAAVQRAPDRVACVFQGQSHRYIDMAHQISAFREQLLAWGVRPGDRVAALSLGHPMQGVALLALADLGAIWVPLNFRLAMAEWRQVLEDCQPRCLLADEAHFEAAQTLARQAQWPCHLLTQSPQPLPAAPATPWPGPVVDRTHDPVLLVYTSGTTGRPKGAVHTQGQMLANARAAIAVQGLNPTTGC